MNKPKMNEFDGWKNSSTGLWYFNVYLQQYADRAAGENGRGVGRVEDTVDSEFMTFVKNAGVIQGVENVINGTKEEVDKDYDSLMDPFYEERQDEDPSGGEEPTG